MNDTYAALFIVAAVTLFAAIWTGAWRWRGAFWVGMPFVGLLLGLGLASKWVALYAVGAIGLLILVRSALGRVVVVLGLSAATAVLGYMAVSVPSGDTAGGKPRLPRGHDRPDAGRRGGHGAPPRSRGPSRRSRSRGKARPASARSSRWPRSRSTVGTTALALAWGLLRPGGASPRARSGSRAVSGSGRWRRRPPRTEPASLVRSARARPGGWLRPGCAGGCRSGGRRVAARNPPIPASGAAAKTRKYRAPYLPWVKLLRQQA